MTSPRSEKLVEKLTRGLSKSLEIFEAVDGDQWMQPIFDEPESWNLTDLVAHFIYSEDHLRSIAQDIAAGGEGAPDGMDIDAFNRDELEKLRHLPTDVLLERLVKTRETTIEWVRGLDESQLDKVGRHPVLEASNVETVIFSIYAHQLLHMRETAPRLRE